MSKVSSKNTKPEILVRKFLFSNGLRYRLHIKKLPGRPDITLAKYKAVVFVNGCFWHGHENCEAATLPMSNVEYWNRKISSNKRRDMANMGKSASLGWKVIIVWECELINSNNRVARLENIIQEISN